MQVTTIGLDLAKNVFQVHGITEDEEVVFNRSLRRAHLLPFFSKLEPCGNPPFMEAYGTRTTQPFGAGSVSSRG